MTESNDPDERRYTRVPVAVHIEIEAAGETRSGHVRDLSLHGCFLACRPPLPVGTACECRLRLCWADEPDAQPLEARPLIRLRGRVTRNSLVGIGVDFDALRDPIQLMHLKNLLLYNAEDPAQLEREFRARDARRTASS